MPSEQGTPLTVEAVKQFVDQFAEEQLAALQVPGAAVVVVHRENILFIYRHRCICQGALV